MNISKLTRWPTIFCLLVAPTLASAHHSYASTFNIEVLNEWEGEVTSVGWRNPHVVFELKGSDAQGQEVLYQVESHSLSIMRRMDIGSNILKVGDQVKVAGHPARHQNNAMFVINLLLPSGQEIVFDPWGEPRWGESVSSSNQWAATEADAEDQQTGIFRVWSTSLVDPDAFPFPEIFDPALTARYPMTDEARAALEAFDPLTDIATLDCAPKGMPAAMEQPYPMEVSQLGDDIHILLEEYAALRVVHMNPDTIADEQPLSLLGYSVGHWEGGTLVVETSRVNFPHFNTIGIPQGLGATFVEQFIPSEDGKTLRYKLMVTDPINFTEPVELTKRWLALPGAKVEPYECVI
jgi:hypothetical protein